MLQERATHKDMCFEFLRFGACSTVAKFGMLCPYSQSIYELQKHNSVNRYRERTFSFNPDFVYNPDLPQSNKFARVGKSSLRLISAEIFLNSTNATSKPFMGFPVALLTL